MSPPAFVSELMGLTLYLAIDDVLDDVFADEPEARDRVRALLREIMTDEMGHVGQRRNFIGPVGLRVSRWMVEPMFRAFYKDIPESRLLFDIEQMIEEGKKFDYGDHAGGRHREELDSELLQRVRARALFGCRAFALLNPRHQRALRRHPEERSDEGSPDRRAQDADDLSARSLPTSGSFAIAQDDAQN